MKHSIIAKTLIIIAAVLFITDAGLLLLGYHSVHTTVQNTYISYARSSAAIAADLLEGVSLSDLPAEGVSLSDLPAEKSLESRYQNTLENLCRTNGLEYLYVYIPDTENKTITYVLLLCGPDSQTAAAQEHMPGTVVEHELNAAELSALNGNGSGSSSETNQFVETDNKYGHVLTCYSAVYDKDGNPAALVGADISMEETSQIFFRRYKSMFVAVVCSMVFVLGVLAAILKVRVLKPAKIISGRMKNFVTDRKNGFEKLDITGSDEFAQMADAFNDMAAEIDSYIQSIHELTEEKQRQEAEINIAKKIQTGFLQDTAFRNQSVKISAVMVPAKYVGGDFYDYFSLDEDRICTVIADVSGKGISAALFMAKALTVVRQYAQLGCSPSEILFRTNNCLSQNNPEQMFLTAFVGIYNSTTQIFTYANGGHNTPYLVSSTLKELEGARGMTVGIFEDESYEEETVTLKNGDTVFLYTDGVNEAVSRDREFFGLSRLKALLGRHPGEKCVEAVLDAVNTFAQGAVQSDDITMLALCISSYVCVQVKAVIENMDVIRPLLLKNKSVPDDIKKKLCLAAEEIFVNICSYAYEGEPGSVEFSLEVSDKVIMKFQDNGKPFNPLENIADIDSYDMDTQIGGLGRLLAVEIADRADYEYTGRQNILTLIKNME